MQLNEFTGTQVNYYAICHHGGTLLTKPIVLGYNEFRERHEMPTVLRVEGFEVMIYSRDHEPRHVHVFKAEGEIIINLDDLSVRRAYGMKGRDARRAQAIVAAQRDFLLEEWGRIDPLS